MKNKKIYIQYDGHRPYNHECSCAVHGAIDLGYLYASVQYEDLEAGLYDDYLTSNLFVGTVEFMNEVFRRIGLDSVRLPKNSNRESKIMTLDEARALITPEKSLFIKPVKLKLFTGFVLDESHYACLDNIPGDTYVYTYPPFEKEIISEWRVYINDGKIELCANYSGDPLKFVDVEVLNYHLKDCNEQNFPKAYTIDIAVFDQHYELDKVVEYNDMWGIGNYGLNNDVYVEMLYKRYFELIKNAPLPEGDVLVITTTIAGRKESLYLNLGDWDKSDILEIDTHMKQEAKYYIENEKGELKKINL